MSDIAIIIEAILAGIGIGYLLRNYILYWVESKTDNYIRRMIDDARRKAEAIIKEAQIKSVDERLKVKEQILISLEEREKNLAMREQRVSAREDLLDKKLAILERKEAILDEKSRKLEEDLKKLEQEKAILDEKIAEYNSKLEEISGMTAEQAKQIIINRVQDELGTEMGAIIRKCQEKIKDMADKDARKIIINSIERCAVAHTVESTTDSITLPGEEMKGRIIGRDGRNIRTLEQLTGVTIVIDDTPEIVVVSSFDPIRREIARRTIEELMKDGRIHPARIEEIVEKVKNNLEELIQSFGESAAAETDVQGLNPQVIRMLGRLKFRTSYTQNVLQHSIETAYLMGLMAGELELDTALARRIGLLHDIGKAMDHKVEGSHAVIGADFLKKNQENQIVVSTIAAHHDEVDTHTPYLYLVKAADAISSVRPGARSETRELYIKRLEKMEEIANSFKGVIKSYAIQAGRELRIFVYPDQVSDEVALVMARDIAKKIETEVEYPGQIKVVVIRETRAVEYAH